MLLAILVPTTGLLLSPIPLALFLEFPPQTLYVRHAAFSLTIWVLLALTVLAALYPFLRKLRVKTRVAGTTAAKYQWPAWALFGPCCIVLCWSFSWIQDPQAKCIQQFSFFGLWLGFIFTFEALLVRIGLAPSWNGAVSRYVLLYPSSAVFWWSFEYLNRFAQNWSYRGIEDYSAVRYGFLASLSFSTVLPAVLAVGRLLPQLLQLQVFENLAPVRWPRQMVMTILLLTIATLFFLPSAPNVLYPMLWLAPVLVLACVADRRGEIGVISSLQKGDWRFVTQWSIAGLFCGFFWEFWNSNSVLKWVYHVPYVSTLHIFEMPLLGYAGYLPFGVFCAMVLQVLQAPTDR